MTSVLKFVIKSVYLLHSPFNLSWHQDSTFRINNLLFELIHQCIELDLTVSASLKTNCMYDTLKVKTMKPWARKLGTTTV